MTGNLATGVLALLGLTFSQAGYSVADAQYVTTSRNPDVLNYVVCLQEIVADSQSMTETGLDQKLTIAANECRNMGNIIAENPELPHPNDLKASILECGFRPGDASLDADCG